MGFKLNTVSYGTQSCDMFVPFGGVSRHLPFTRFVERDRSIDEWVDKWMGVDEWMKICVNECEDVIVIRYLWPSKRMRGKDWDMNKNERRKRIRGNVVGTIVWAIVSVRQFPLIAVLSAQILFVSHYFWMNPSTHTHTSKHIQTSTSICNINQMKEITEKEKEKEREREREREDWRGSRTQVEEMIY